MLNNFNFNRETVNTSKTPLGSLLLTSVLILTSSFIFIIPTISAVGDLNNDDKVDFADILIVIKWIFNIERTNNASDVNGDGEVNIFDVVIVSRLLGKQYGIDTTEPGIISHRPSATILPLGTTSVVVGVEVNEKAVCRYTNVSGGNFTTNMTLFERTGGIFNSYNATGLQNNQSYNYYVKCMDEAGNLNSTDYYFNFSVGLPAEGDTTAPVRSAGSPSGTLAAGTTQTTLSLTTNEAATCRYSNVSGTAYASITNTFSTTGSTSHSQLITGLTNGSSYNYYVRCNDSSGNVNTDDYAISFSVSSGVDDGSEPLYNSSIHTSLSYQDFESFADTTAMRAAIGSCAEQLGTSSLDTTEAPPGSNKSVRWDYSDGWTCPGTDTWVCTRQSWTPPSGRKHFYFSWWLKISSGADWTGCGGDHKVIDFDNGLAVPRQRWLLAFRDRGEAYQSSSGTIFCESDPWCNGKTWGFSASGTADEWGFALLGHKNLDVAGRSSHIADGNWHRITLHLYRASAVQTGDGIVQLWVDGVQIIDADGSDPESPAYGKISLGGNLNADQPQTQQTYDTINDGAGFPQEWAGAMRAYYLT